MPNLTFQAYLPPQLSQSYAGMGFPIYLEYNVRNGTVQRGGIDVPFSDLQSLTACFMVHLVYNGVAHPFIGPGSMVPGGSDYTDCLWFGVTSPSSTGAYITTANSTLISVSPNGSATLLLDNQEIFSADEVEARLAKASGGMTILRSTCANADSGGDYRHDIIRIDGTPARVGDFLNPVSPAIVFWDTGKVVLTFTSVVDSIDQKLYLIANDEARSYLVTFDGFNEANPSDALPVFAHVDVYYSPVKLSQMIGSLIDLRTLRKDNLVSAINYLNDKVAPIYPVLSYNNLLQPASQTNYKVSGQDTIRIADYFHHVTFKVEVVSPVQESAKVLLEQSKPLMTSKDLTFVFLSAAGVGNPLVVVVDNSGIHLYGGHVGQTYSVILNYLP